MSKRRFGQFESQSSVCSDALSIVKKLISRIPLHQYVVISTSQAMEDDIQNTLAKAIGIDLPRLIKLLKTANLVSNSARDEGKLFVNNQQLQQLISSYSSIFRPASFSLANISPADRCLAELSAAVLHLGDLVC